MKFRGQRRHAIDLVFTLGLFAVFALLAMMLVMIGANAYRATAARMENNFTTRTSLAYISEKMHQYDRLDGIRMAEVEGRPAVAMQEAINGTPYTTYIYFYDGNVCELFIETDSTPECGQGTPVIEAENMEIEEVADQCFRLTVTDKGGNTAQTFVRPVSKLKAE